MKHRPLAALDGLMGLVFAGDPRQYSEAEFIEKMILLFEAGRASVLGQLEQAGEKFVYRAEVTERVRKVDEILTRLPKLASDLQKFDTALRQPDIDQFDAFQFIVRVIKSIDEIPVVWDKLMQVEAYFAR